MLYSHACPAIISINRNLPYIDYFQKEQLLWNFMKNYKDSEKKGLTQEELAQSLFVSRTAISKWESGRGYPSIDSLKAIAGFFGVTIDELLSGDELLTIAEEDTKQKEKHIRDLVFGMLDCSIAMFFFLPFFGQEVNAAIHGVSLLSLTEIAPYLKTVYFVVVIAVYILFEMFVANYRPVLIEGFLEASYPSSTTMLVMCVMPTAIMQFDARIRNAVLKRIVSSAIIAFIVFMVIGRLISGVHWFTDIVGGALLSAGLVLMYRCVCGLRKKQCLSTPVLPIRKTWK